MPIDISVPNSPGWWLNRLGKQISDRCTDLDLLESYYRGDPPLPEGAGSSREAFRMFQRKARANYAKLIVEAVRPKMIVTGFRTGADGDDVSDAEAWRIWQANHLGADSALVHWAQLVLRDGYVIVGAPDETGIPVITPEDPRQVITAHDPVRRRKVIAALKMYHDDVTGQDVAYLYPKPGWVVRARREHSKSQSWSVSGWEWDGEPQQLSKPVVPVVRFANDPGLLGHSVGEFEDFIDILDRINHMILQRMVIATLQAFRQRAVKGVPLTDADGEDIDYAGIFSADPGALWLLPETAEMWESGQVDLSPILNAVQADVKELAAVTQTPLYLLASDATNQSAEGASLMRESNTAKVRDRMKNAGESWAQVMSLAFLLKGDEERASAVDLEVLWEPPESYSLTERSSAAAQAKAAGVPWQTIMSEIMRFSPPQINRMLTQRADDMLLLPEPVNAAPPAQ